VVGPLFWEPPTTPVELPAGDRPLVVVAPSTSQDPAGRLVRTALAALADLPVRVVAVSPDPSGTKTPANARVVEWLSYAAVMPHADVVVCHGGHGTVARALSCGLPLVVCPAAGDMFENAARVVWAGVGVRVPRRRLRPRALQEAVHRVLEHEEIRLRAGAADTGGAEHDGARHATTLVESLAEQTG
jgi:UDP:flavonoid glycosyltransferase YjiC (YdhE family)